MAIQKLFQPSIQERIQATSHFSNCFLSDLQRQYLNFYFNEITNIELIENTNKLGDPSFAKLEQIGNVDSNSVYNPFEAIKTTLSAHHQPERYKLIFTVSSDGQENHIYWGVQSRDQEKFPPKDFIQHISNFLEGIWQGTNLKYCPNHPETSPEGKTHIIEQLENFKYATALTGIPSLKLENNPQTLKYLMNGMRGKKFMYMVIAEPISEHNVHKIIFNLREMLTPINLISEVILNESATQSQGGEEDKRKDYTKTTEAIKTITKNLTVSAKYGKFFGVSTRFLDSDASKTSSAEKDSIGSKTKWNESQQQAFSRKLINAHAQTVEKRINQYIERFEEASILECWNVGIYFLAEQQITAEVGGSQLKSLLSGQKSIIEPLRVHNLEKIFTTGKNPASKILQRFEQPNLKLINSDTKKQMDHPLGRLFNGLTTPLNTEELALLVNVSQD